MKSKTIKNIFISLILLLLVFVGQFSFIGSVARADTTIYTNILDDLKKDSNFNENDYKQVNTDYSINVIQIAESSDNELFIYTYQPSGQNYNLMATKINISQTTGDLLNYKNYNLTYLNSNGVFYKYKVNNFTISKEDIRYYDISSIYRAWNSQIDKTTSNDNTISNVAYSVSKLFVAKTLSNSSYYSVLDTESIVITEKFVDFLRYEEINKPFLKKSYVDSHYIAFSCNYDISTLYEADVYFVSQSVDIKQSVNQGLPGIIYGDKKENYVTLSSIDKVSTSPSGLVTKKYSWNRIEKVSDFLENETLTDETITNISNKQWILRFYESDYTLSGGSVGDATFGHRVEVTDVTILRLYFESEGLLYNLGVVDNMNSGDSSPGNPQPKGLLDWLIEIFLKLINFFKNLTWKKFVLILLIIVAIVLSPLWFPLFLFILKYLLKGIVYLLKLLILPFKKIFNKD